MIDGRLLPEIIIRESGFTSEMSTFSNGKRPSNISMAITIPETTIFLPDINMPVLNGREFLDELNTRAYGDRVFVARFLLFR